MSKFKIETKGLDKAIADLTKRGKSIAPSVRTGVIKTTNECKREAKSNCPVDTGLLRNSIHSEVKNKSGEIEGEISTNLEYSAYVEFGTGQTGVSTNTNAEVDVSYKADWKGQKAQPYMYPAYVKTRDKLVPNIEKELNKILKGAG